MFIDERDNTYIVIDYQNIKIEFLKVTNKGSNIKLTKF